MSQIKAAYPLSAYTRLEVAQGDLTQEKVDCIVNAANLNLNHGGGVAGAIARAGGPIIQEESDAWVREHGTVSHDEPAYTRGGSLPARYVIHAVGPVWGEGEEDRKLEEAIRGSLARAVQLEARSVAFPAISTGIYGFPRDRAAQVFCETFREYFTENPQSPLELVRMTLWDAESVSLFLEAADRLLKRRA